MSINRRVLPTQYNKYNIIFKTFTLRGVNMKSLAIFFTGVLIAYSFISCDTTESDTDDPNILGGDTNVPLGQVGNTFETGAIFIGNNSYDINSSIEIIANDNGVATIQIKADLTQIPGLKNIIDLIPDTMKDTEGYIDAEFKFKITSEGLQDNLNGDEKLHTMVKYDGRVGDAYPLSTSTGTIRRTITERSNADDFPYGSFLIKTIKVEQDSRIPGVSKIEYRFNHRFGLVYFEVFMEDGTSASVYLFPNNF
jgi:hypothetical protein